MTPINGLDVIAWVLMVLLYVWRGSLGQEASE